jgi:hypothetical protein
MSVLTRYRGKVAPWGVTAVLSSLWAMLYGRLDGFEERMNDQDDGRYGHDLEVINIRMPAHYFYSIPTASLHTRQCLMIETRSRSGFVVKPSFALMIPKPLITILIDIMIHSLAQLGRTKNSESWYEDVRCCM